MKKAISFIEQNGLSWDDLVNDISLLHHIGLNEKNIENIHLAKETSSIMFDKLESAGVEVITENEKKYPLYLKKMLGNSCPSTLFISGNADLLNSISVGFCGSRKTSDKGICIASNCVKQLVESNITVVSGYAGGTDLAAHKTALENGGNTVFVVAEGILRCSKKKEIKDFLTDKNHVFISQFMPNTTWNAGNAMRRNSIIIGLSRAMVLVESGMSGGTFGAGEEALKVGCPLFVIDFFHPEDSAKANPYFLTKGGRPIRGKNGIPNISKVLETVRQDSRSEIDISTENNNSQLKLDV